MKSEKVSMFRDTSGKVHEVKAVADLANARIAIEDWVKVYGTPIDDRTSDEEDATIDVVTAKNILDNAPALAALLRTLIRLTPKVEG